MKNRIIGFGLLTLNIVLVSYAYKLEYAEFSLAQSASFALLQFELYILATFILARVFENISFVRMFRVFSFSLKKSKDGKVVLLWYFAAALIPLLSLLSSFFLLEHPINLPMDEQMSCWWCYSRAITMILLYAIGAMVGAHVVNQHHSSG